MLTTRLYAWSREHTLALDTYVAALLVVALGPLSYGVRGWPGLVFGVLSLAPLAVRRRWPVAVLAFVLAVSLAQVVALPGVLPANVAQPFVLYTVAAHVTSFRIRLVALGFGLLGSLLVVLRLSAQEDWASALAISGSLAVFMSLVWAMGNLVRGREAMVDELRRANASLEHEREQRDLVAAQRERVRVARDVHDIVAHSLSVVVVQADGAAYAAEHSPDWGPGAAADALTAIGETAQAALAETRNVVAVLRDDEGESTASTAAGLTDIHELIESVRSAGLQVVLDADITESAEMGEETSLTAYRVVQEGLTNVLKHAGPDASGSVRLERTPGGVRVTVTDDGVGLAVPLNGAGSGLKGMRERVLACGGEFVAGPRAAGGFAVTATLPARSPAIVDAGRG